ncbi:MAG: hypothetical protein Q9226_004999, partial [Calogaya cf. arnoldii]
MLERICINSDLLVKMLCEITGLDLQGPLVILRPFKILLHWESKICQRLMTLESNLHDLMAMEEQAKRTSVVHADEDKETQLHAGDSTKTTTFATNSTDPDRRRFVEENEVAEKDSLGDNLQNTEDRSDDDSLGFTLRDRSSPLVISCVRVDFDGKVLASVVHTFTVEEYTGRKSIRTMPVIPWTWVFDPAWEDRSMLEDRGAWFLKLTKGGTNRHQEYTGLTIEPREDVDSQVIVDFETTIQQKPEWMPSFEVEPPLNYDPRETANAMGAGAIGPTERLILDCRENRASWVHEDGPIDWMRMQSFVQNNASTFRKSTPGEFDENHRILLPERVFGYVLRSRSWAVLNMNFLKDRTPKPDEFNQLILPNGHAELIKALVHTHSQDPRSTVPSTDVSPRFDLVKGKGKGSIILCHGAPGVGKANTAECIADSTDRPLFPITCGDVGETAAM